MNDSTIQELEKLSSFLRGAYMAVRPDPISQPFYTAQCMTNEIMEKLKDKDCLPSLNAFTAEEITDIHWALSSLINSENLVNRIPSIHRLSILRDKIYNYPLGS